MAYFEHIVHHQRGEFWYAYLSKQKKYWKKIKLPERDWNPRHPDLTKGALTSELPRQPQWSESNISYKGTSIARHLLPDLSGWKFFLLIVETKAHWTRCYSKPLDIVCNKEP